MKITEKKTRYDRTVVSYDCLFVRRQGDELVLQYEIPEPFDVCVDDRTMHIPALTYTIAFYWEDRPYNVYHWRSPQGEYLGSYVNIVRDTVIAEECVSYTDLIVDVLVFPDGTSHVLDLDELPLPLDTFEDGRVNRDLQQLLLQLADVISYVTVETNRLIGEGKITGVDTPAR
ncbi:DUF402 domain-containing protein [Numidum massiliense]|uniref:DUF402 domain-containing protein n=1 Tax=Numidum massiliense TaxID=1522315 RepID=UPI0006D56DE4|nr:DUF402 domain-containing protein [Numidum massiliense]